MKKSKKDEKAYVGGGNSKRIIINTLAVLAIIALFLLLRININSKQKMVSIVQTKEETFINRVLEKKNMQSHDIPLIEYESSVNKYLLWKDVDKLDQKFATVYTKKMGYIFTGDWAESKPIKNAWLEEVKEGNLIAELPYDKNSNFGNILTPGDSLKVNINYQSDELNKIEGFSGVSARIENDTLFKRVKVLDCLNNSGNSIYDYYTELLNLPVGEREKLLKDEDFLSKVSPVSILISVESENEFNKYSRMKGLPSINYIYGLYPRKEGDIILDQFKDLTRQITSMEATASLEKGGK